MKLSAVIRKLQDIEFDHGDPTVRAPEEGEIGYYKALVELVNIDSNEEGCYPVGKYVVIKGELCTM